MSRSSGRPTRRRRRSRASRARAASTVARPGRGQGATEVRSTSTSRPGSSRRSCGAGSSRSARHHGPHLRHLPRRLPDELGPRDGGGVRRDGRAALRAAPPPPLLRRVDREPRPARRDAPRPRLPRLRERDPHGQGPPRGSSRRASRLKKVGNEVVTVVGGREIHPVNVRVGGFYKAPAEPDLAPLGEKLRAGGPIAAELLRSRAASLPRLRPPTTSSSRSATPTSTPSARGGSSRAADSTSPSPTTRTTSSRSTSSTRTRSIPARAGASTSSGRSRATPQLRPAPPADPGGARRPPASGPSCRNPFRSIVVRSVETLWAVDEALRIIDAYEPPRLVPGGPSPAASGAAISEAPRRHPLPPLPDRRGRPHPGGEDRPAHLTEPEARSRTTCAPS